MPIWSEHAKQIPLILLGSIITAVGLQFFLLPNHLLDGGVTGVSIIVAKLLGVPLGVLLMLLNIPFVYLGYRKFGKQFAAYSAIGIVTLALLTMVHLPRRRSKEPLTQWIIKHSLSYLMPTK